jgi:phosphoenolpyruvate carboxykinase (ATP)
LLRHAKLHPAQFATLRQRVGRVFARVPGVTGALTPGLNVQTSSPSRLDWLNVRGLSRMGRVHWNLSVPELVEYAVAQTEGRLSKTGSFVAHTGEHTGRSAQDKYVVKEKVSNSFWWSSPYQRQLSVAHFEALWQTVCLHLRAKKTFVVEAQVGTNSAQQLPVRVVCERAWHALFTRHLLVPLAGDAVLEDNSWTVIVLPSLKADPAVHGGRTGTMIALSFERQLILIVGTEYAGEIKKSLFTVMNALLPLQQTLPMHCSANIGTSGDTALFFGMSGTGKTTLSADSTRLLIGDDEHAWDDTGIWNLEGGCYAKVIRLSLQDEPEIYRAAHTFGSVLENVVMDPHHRTLDLSDETLTENTRAAYPLAFLENTLGSGRVGHPRHVFFLTADAFGVLPPLSKLTPDQATYYFLSGYTAKLAGTEQGVLEPQVSFEPCFGAPFLPLPPEFYAELLTEKLSAHGTQVWLVNTGWTGGPYGSGQRMSIEHTRRLIRAVLDGQLDQATFEVDQIFGLDVPLSVPGIPANMLQPSGAWSDLAAYECQARQVALMFRHNFEPYAAGVSEGVRQSGPSSEP